MVPDVVTLITPVPIRTGQGVAVEQEAPIDNVVGAEYVNAKSPSCDDTAGANEVGLHTLVEWWNTRAWLSPGNADESGIPCKALTAFAVGVPFTSPLSTTGSCGAQL